MCDLRFSLWCCWRFYDICIKQPTLPELLDPVYEGTTMLRNVTNCLLVDTVHQPRRPESMFNKLKRWKSTERFREQRKLCSRKPEIGLTNACLFVWHYLNMSSTVSHENEPLPSRPSKPATTCTSIQNQNHSFTYNSIRFVHLFTTPSVLIYKDHSVASKHLLKILYFCIFHGAHI